MLRTFVPPKAVWMPNRASPVIAGPPPGSNWARPTNERLMIGRSASCFSETTPDRSDFVVSMVAAVALTSTVSLTPPTVMVTLMSDTPPTVKVTLRVSVLNPISSEVTWYGPGGRAGARNSPLASLTSTRSRPVFML